MKPRWYQDEAVKAALQATDNSVVVLPTGAGKTLVMKEIVRQSTGGILVLSHVKEILEQNFNSLVGLGNIGLYSAGLGVKHIDRVTVAGIQSVYNKPELFQHVDRVLVDECHLVNDTGMYHKLLKKLDVPFIGLTATPFRLKEGYIHKEDGVFDSICYEAPVNKLTDQGYLSPLVTYGSMEDEFDLEGVATTGGDFNISDMAMKYNRDAITEKIVKQLIKYKTKYKHWLLFCIDIDHAEQVSRCLNNMGITAEAVHSNAPRDQAILDFKAGKVQAITNVNILTIGFDYPEIDLIVMLRPTKSPTLHVQALGRGLRKAPGKEHCLVKDYAGNIKRLGMIDNLKLNPQGKSTGKGDAWLKTCPDCEMLHYPAVRKCQCGHEFKFEHHLSTTATTVIKKKWYKVNKVMYNIHTKPGKPDSVKVTYVCGARAFSEWVGLNHGGYMGYKAKHWVTRRWKLSEPKPNSTLDLYKHAGKLWTPEEIEVEEVGKYPKIVQMK